MAWRLSSSEAERADTVAVAMSSTWPLERQRVNRRGGGEKEDKEKRKKMGRRRDVRGRKGERRGRGKSLASTNRQSDERIKNRHNRKKNELEGKEIMATTTR